MNIKKQHRISLKDIAVELGVSIATVSRALRDSPEIGKEMQIKVKDMQQSLMVLRMRPVVLATVF